MVVPIPARPPTFLVADEPEGKLMWQRLAHAQRAAEQAMETPSGRFIEDIWEYRGTWFVKGAWKHHFRHRSLDGSGSYVTIEASPDWRPEDGITRQDTTDSTEES